MTKQDLTVNIEIKKILTKDIFVQGFNGLPIFLNSAAWTGFSMKKDLGFGYTKFAFHYHGGAGEMVYLKSDFKNIWRQTPQRIRSNRNYLKKIKKLYEFNLRRNHRLFRLLDQLDLRKISKERLIDLFHKAVEGQINSGNVGHIIEGLSYGADIDLRKLLTAELSDNNNFNKVYAELAAPTKLSFVAKEQAELFAISKLPLSKQAPALSAHTKRYFWIHNSYAGAKHLTQAFFAAQMKVAQRPVVKSTIAAKRVLVKNLGLSRQTFRMANIIDFLSVWQDERKANLMQAVAYLDRVARELERRTGLPKEHLSYLTTQEGLSLSLENCFKMKNLLSSRAKGVYILMTAQGEWVISGNNYKKFLASQGIKFDQTQSELRGMTANPGTVSGKAVLCTSLKMLSKVRPGNILVATMTRPEFMPALRKAAAIVTDEGGITSHAAIVARELGIPAVIGTKNATKLIKDGMALEVRANHGLVRIISR